MSFRKILFWVHLVAGVIAGLVIAVMCFTGAALAFESELISWSERDARSVAAPPAGAARLPLQALLAAMRDAEPDTRPSAIVVSSDPRDAVAFQLGREGAIYANPYTGEVKKPASTQVHDFLHVLEDWHRTLALSGNQRPTGKLINGISNLAFCVLAVTGLYLWMPRAWSWRSVRAIALFDWKFRGKARDFNWHNVIGLWSAPVLIVLTLTAVPISFRWGSNLVYRLAGETPPAAPASGAAPQGPGAGGFAPPSVPVPTPPPGTRRLDYDALLAAAQTAAPDWQLLTIRLGNARGGNGGGNAGGRRGGTAPAGAATSAAVATAAPAPASERAERPRENSVTARPEGRAEGRTAASAVSITVKQPGQWPRTATTTLSLNPYTGEILKREGYGDQSPGRQLRTWTRFLHTGQALGMAGQLVAGLACLGGCVLVYTGFALAIRRFFAWRKKQATA